MAMTHDPESMKTTPKRPKIILASASPRRQALLKQIFFQPDVIAPADIDETPAPKELPRSYVQRVAIEKAEVVANRFQGSIILAADAAVACGRRILPKAEDANTARECLALISGRSHRVYSGVALIDARGTIKKKIVETRVKVRHLHEDAITEYLASGEWNGKAGGYAIQGLFAAHIISIIGSYTNVVGLPLYETENLLISSGAKKVMS